MKRTRSDRYKGAVADVDAWLASRPEAGRRLSAAEFARYRNEGAAAGWLVRVGFADGITEFHVVVGESFPRQPPRVVLANTPRFLTYPHVETNGALCLLPESAGIDIERPVSVLTNLLASAAELISESRLGKNKTDFRDEFLSYWNGTVGMNATLVVSLLLPTGTSRLIQVFQGRQFHLAAETTKEAEEWLRNRYNDSSRYETRDGLLLQLRAPLLPEEYPETASDVLAIAQRQSDDGASLLNRLLLSNHEKIPVLLGADTVNGSCFAAVMIPPRSQVALSRGFRKGSTPRAVVLDRSLSKKVVKAQVQRADAAWIHGRDHDTRFGVLRDSQVTVIGAGSVGSLVASSLARAGVGRIHIVDPEPLSFANVGRHVLGADAVGANKAEALAHQLLRELPHMKEATGHPTRWQDVLRTSPQQFTDANLIVCATGNWGGGSRAE